MAGKFLLFVDGSKVSEDRGISLVAGDNITLAVVETQTGLPEVEITGAAGGAGDTLTLTFSGNAV